jgi:hypothetical protein
MFQQRHYEALAGLMREAERDSITLDALRDRMVAMFAADNERFKEALFRTAAGVKLSAENAAKLLRREFFVQGELRGEPVTPWRQLPEYERWAKGSVARLFSGQADAGHYVHVNTMDGGASPLPPLGLLDPAPAMAMALGESSYIVRSHGTVIAWYLGPEVYGAGEGEWVEAVERMNDEYGRFTAYAEQEGYGRMGADIDADEDAVHAALAGE